MPLPFSHSLAAASVLAAAAMAGATAFGTPAAPPGGATPRDDRAVYAPYLATYRPPAPVAFPDSNAYTSARRALGKLLFFDRRLSGAQDVSCASCHDPSYSWTDRHPRAIGTGGGVLGRRTPTVLNTAWAAALFWDGRAETLEDQALGPIQAAGEMNMALGAVEQRLNAVPEYRARFAAAYGPGPVTANNIARALATFERTLVSGTAPFDRWVAGDARAIPAEAKRGFVLFNTTAGCAKCHGGWRFTDDSFHDIGVPGADSGRGRLVPGVDALAYAFKTPTLRNVADRAPYLHDGSARTLDAVVDLYDRGGADPHTGVRRPSVAEEVRPLHLASDDKRALVAFLRTLSSRDTVAAPARLPR